MFIIRIQAFRTFNKSQSGKKVYPKGRRYTQKPTFFFAMFVEKFFHNCQLIPDLNPNFPPMGILCGGPSSPVHMCGGFVLFARIYVVQIQISVCEAPYKLCYSVVLVGKLRKYHKFRPFKHFCT